MIVSRWFVEGIPQTNSKPKRNISEAISISRLFTIVAEMEITNEEAERILSILKQRGLLEKIRQAEEWVFITYLLDFYNYETSPYVREKLANFVGESTKRGILNDKETTTLFLQNWKDERSYLGNLVASTSGLRSGEVLGLKQEDIGLDRLFIRHSYSPLDGLKCPKNSEKRQVPLLLEIREGLLKLATKDPWDDGFIFYSDKENQPMDHKHLNNGLRDAMEKMEISKEESKSRNIVFHSWRHRYASQMADLLDARSLGLATGHKTQSILEHYADHANENHFQAVKEASEKAFVQ